MAEQVASEIARLAAALRRLLPGGLPPSLGGTERCLLDLRGVIARSADPDDDVSRLEALNRILLEQLPKVPPRRQRNLAAAATVLFGKGKGGARLDLTRRYEEAARACDYGRDHFRQVIVQQILEQLATQLHQDSANYRGRRRSAVEITGDTPSIEPRHLDSRDVARHEEVLSRLWEYVYGLRAELLAVQRLKMWPDHENNEFKLTEARESVLWYLARLMGSIKTYVAEYGGRVGKGEAEYDVEGLIRLAGWTGEMPVAIANHLRMLAAQESTKEGFVREIRIAGIRLEAVGD